MSERVFTAGSLAEPGLLASQLEWRPKIFQGVPAAVLSIGVLTNYIMCIITLPGNTDHLPEVSLLNAAGMPLAQHLGTDKEKGWCRGTIWLPQLMCSTAQHAGRPSLPLHITAASATSMPCLEPLIAAQRLQTLELSEGECVMLLGVQGS